MVLRARVCGWLGQSVPIHEIVNGAGSSVAQRRIVSVAWRNLFIAERPPEAEIARGTERVAINTARRINDRYRASAKRLMRSCKVDRDRVVKLFDDRNYKLNDLSSPSFKSLYF